MTRQEDMPEPQRTFVHRETVYLFEPRSEMIAESGLRIIAGTVLRDEAWSPKFLTNVALNTPDQALRPVEDKTTVIRPTNSLYTEAEITDFAMQIGENPDKTPLPEILADKYKNSRLAYRIGMALCEAGANK